MILVLGHQIYTQACRGAPTLGKTESFPCGACAQMQRAWPPGRYMVPAPGSEWQEGALPAISKHEFSLIHAFSPQL
jgi:hypothetical protein